MTFSLSQKLRHPKLHRSVSQRFIPIVSCIASARPSSSPNSTSFKRLYIHMEQADDTSISITSHAFPVFIEVLNPASPPPLYYFLHACQRRTDDTLLYDHDRRHITVLLSARQRTTHSAHINVSGMPKHDVQHTFTCQYRSSSSNHSHTTSCLRRKVVVSNKALNINLHLQHFIRSKTCTTTSTLRNSDFLLNT